MAPSSRTSSSERVKCVKNLIIVAVIAVGIFIAFQIFSFLSNTVSTFLGPVGTLMDGARDTLNWPRSMGETIPTPNVVPTKIPSIRSPF